MSLSRLCRMSLQQATPKNNCMKTEKEISDLIYETLDYMYCDNCRYNTEEIEDEGDYPCEDCYRKYNNWAVSRSTCDSLAQRICG